MEELVARIVAASGLDAQKARDAIASILAFLKKDGPSDEVATLFAALPGADAAAAGAETGFGGLMGLAGHLTGMGLDMGDMQVVGRELLNYGREKAGEDTVGAITGAIPGLSQFL